MFTGLGFNVNYLDISIDYNGECESIDEFLVNTEKTSIDYQRVNEFINQIVNEVEGFNLSEHRTQVQVWWKVNGNMDIRYRYYNEPDQGEFDDFEILDVPRIEL
jgi:hypothetical protein